MANKRSLKRVISLICDELFTEAIAASLYGNDKHQANAEALLFSIVKLESEYIKRISHVEPGLKPALYFKDLREKFNAEVSDIIDQINAL
jgi:hypothetical protein